MVLQYSAADVPVLQIGLSSKTLSEQQLQDLGSNFIRTRLANIQGSGPFRVLTAARTAWSPSIWIRRSCCKRTFRAPTSSTAVNNQNLVVPQGTAKIGDREYDVALNSSAKTIDELNDLPVKMVNGAMVYLRDVAYVHDGASFQTNIARRDGQRGVLQVVLKHGKASTLDIVSRVRAALPKIAATLPPELQMSPGSDQSIFVRAAVNGVLREAIIAAGLTAALILLFLGSWRSTLVVAISIPLSILTSLLILSLLGETINIMTLGGLALAVGILVDDATVEIENINRLMPEGMPLRDTILTGAQQIAAPAFVATLSICIVFVPIFFLKGVPGFLFRPLAEAVVFAMLASYFLSRTLVPTLVMYFFRAERTQGAKHDAAGTERPGFFSRFHHGFEERFDDCATATCARSNGACAIGWFLALCFWASARPPCCWCRSSAPIFSPPWMPARFACICARRSARASRKLRRCATRWSNPSAGKFPKTNSAGILDNIGFPIQRHQPDPRQQRRDRHLRCRDSYFPHARSPHQAGRLHPRASAHPAPRISGNGVLLPARGHRQPGSQFRIARRPSTCS